jgi:hypothetical protein
MNCSNIERLLPLYARVDLDRSSQSAVATHLESCAHCRQLADEYKNIQGWIRLHEPPEFGEEFFAGIRQNVLREIGPRPAHSSTLSTWLRKLVALPTTTFAAAATALLIISFALGLVVFREYRSRPEFYAQDETPRSEPQKVVNANSGTLPTEDKSQTLQEVKNGSGSGVAFSGSSGNNVNRVRHRITRTTPRATTLPTKDTLASVTRFTSTDSSSARSVESGLSEGQLPLRVEMQTQNPNIRIIWFAPNAKKSSVTN